MGIAEERMQILKMIEEGKISAREGAELIRAIEYTDQEQRAEPLRGATPARWFRVRITDMSSGRNKVNVNIPIGLVNVGLKMGARFIPENVDSAEYQQVMEAIRSGRQGKIFDLTNNEENERIEIFVE